MTSASKIHLNILDRSIKRNLIVKKKCDRNNQYYNCNLLRYLCLKKNIQYLNPLTPRIYLPISSVIQVKHRIKIKYFI